MEKLLFQLIFSTYLHVVLLKFRSGALVGCGIEFPIQWMLPIEIWVKPHGDKLRIWVEKVVCSLVFYYFNHLLNLFICLLKKMVTHPLWLTSSPWILLVLINLIFLLYFCFETHFWLQNFSNDGWRGFKSW